MCVENDGQIKYQKRSGQVAAEIPDAAIVEADDGKQIVHSRGPVAEAVDQVQVSFFQADNGYQRGAASAGLPSTEESALSRTELPIAMTPDEGAAVAARWLSETHVARDTVTVTLSPSMLAVMPGDVIQLANNAARGLYRIDRIEDVGGRRVTATRVEAGVYQPGRTTTDRAENATYSLPGPVWAEVIDLPLLSEGDSAHAPYIAAAGAPWTGKAAVFSSNADAGYSRETLGGTRCGS